MRTTIDEARLEAFLGRAVTDLAAAESAVACYIGDRLGLYKAMAEADWLTSAELAAATGTNERLVLEWLRNQAAGEYVEHDNGQFRLPAEHAVALADPQSPAFLGGIYQVIASMWADVEIAEKAFRGDGGIGWGDHDPRLYEGVDRLFGPIYRAYLASEWLPALDGVVGKLDAGGRVADVGCGFGSSTIVLAEAFPAATVVGYDFHGPSIEEAQRRAKESGLQDRPQFEVLDAGELPEQGFDLVCFFDALHDMGNPVSAAASARRALAEGGVLMAVEPKAADELDDNITPANRLFYAGSTFLCTPSALAQHGEHALGAQAGPAAITQVLHEAGFGHVRVAAETPFNYVFEARA
jgi:2-polyprenyl-3-methyl-5-hydroxy-6-metoxy-1,4-benzoquinol methylase